MTIKRSLTVLVLATLALAVGAPLASARPVDDPALPNLTSSTETVDPVVYKPTAAAEDSGFDWGDAGIGALATVAVLAICAGLVLLAGQRRDGSRDGAVAA